MQATHHHTQSVVCGVMEGRRFSVHGWNHSLDIDLCRSVMQVIGDNFPTGEQVIADDFPVSSQLIAGNSPAGEHAIVDYSAKNQQAIANKCIVNNQGVANDSPNHQPLADHSPNNTHAFASDFPTDEPAIAEVASSDKTISFDADTRTLYLLLSVSRIDVNVSNFRSTGRE